MVANVVYGEWRWQPYQNVLNSVFIPYMSAVAILLPPGPTPPSVLIRRPSPYYPIPPPFHPGPGRLNPSSDTPCTGLLIPSAFTPPPPALN